MDHDFKTKLRVLLWLLLLRAPQSTAQDCLSTDDAKVLLATPWASQVGWDSTTQDGSWLGLSCTHPVLGLSMYVYHSPVSSHCSLSYHSQLANPALLVLLVLAL